jgi:hypothetical protein
MRDVTDVAIITVTNVSFVCVADAEYLMTHLNIIYFEMLGG